MKKWSFDPQNLAEGVFGTKAHFFMSFFFWAAVQAGEELVKWGKILSVNPFVSLFVRLSPPPQLALRSLQLALKPPSWPSDPSSWP